MKNYPTVHFYDQDIVDLYCKSWERLDVLIEDDAVRGSFHLGYSHDKGGAEFGLDLAYFRPASELELYAWAEQNLYHKTGNKRRVKEVLPILNERFHSIDCRKNENGLYLSNGCYPVAFNASMAINALYLSDLAEIINDREVSAHFGIVYHQHKNRMNRLLWNEKAGQYCDLTHDGLFIPASVESVALSLIAEVPSFDRAEKLISSMPKPVDSWGAFLTAKGLERYGKYTEARTFAIKYLYDVVERGLAPGDAPATIAMMIENVLGVYLSAPKKTLEWKLSEFEDLGIDGLMMRNTPVCASLRKIDHKWRIRTKGRKLFYFVADLMGKGETRMLPIPADGCLISIG